MPTVQFKVYFTLTDSNVKHVSMPETLAPKHYFSYKALISSLFSAFLTFPIWLCFQRLDF